MRFRVGFSLDKPVNFVQFIVRWFRVLTYLQFVRFFYPCYHICLAETENLAYTAPADSGIVCLNRNFSYFLRILSGFRVEGICEIAILATASLRAGAVKSKTGLIFFAAAFRAFSPFFYRRLFHSIILSQTTLFVHTSHTAYAC